MNQRASTQPSFPFGRGLMRRGWWALLALVHLWPLFGVARSLLDEGVSAAGALKIAALGFTLAFFILKLIDVRWLRCRMRPASWLAFALACVLVHHDLRPEAVERAVLAELPTAAATAAAVELTRRAARCVPSLIHTFVRLLSHANARDIVPIAWLNAFDQRRSELLRAGTALIPRAPPA